MNAPRFEFTPENFGRVVKPLPHEIFTFGSNFEGKHRKGAALDAVKYFGAVDGIAMGPQGNSYAVITKDLSQKDLANPDYAVRMLNLISAQLQTYAAFAKCYPWFHFYLTPIGTGLGGLLPESVALLAWPCVTVPNIILPRPFADVLGVPGKEITATGSQDES